ncbi:amino acid/polyamine/organocation transporter (APC superfamily) [Haloactinopolyspora alba]|uniref:Amino acid/polyamine/organocation transporter (APC superfamily) n=1 Tax=Haloactinopolyspora alba TaxID=648780 RepID=A0A2P8DJZ3_9ACTN|nr:APC family permease [Haloactinopolyspora alba]PSK97545.1 amino acid/polyamine/organocation transporter (APC superfamily) [Haloactinopolyspora alba]
MNTSDSRLSRRLGTTDAVAVGLAAMIGTGVFVAWRPAADLAGPWLLAGLAIAAFVAYCNATSTAQLAAVHPRSGGAYHYGRERLGRHWGAVAGYAFVLGKTASCATAALAVGGYLWPAHDVPVALAAVVAVTAVDLAGVRTTATVSKVLVAFVVAVLVTVAVAAPLNRPDGVDLTAAADGVGPWAVLGSAAVMFYAFAGYARITTLGEEVRDPRSIPRAVTVSLLLVLVLYAAVGLAVLLTLGPSGAAAAQRPLHAVVDVAGVDRLAPFVVAAAVVAALGAALSLLAGIGRTSFAMAAEGDLPRALAAVHPRRRIPHRAELAASGLTILAVLLGDLAETLTASAFGVLVYFAVANAAAWRLAARERSHPRVLAALGLVSCVLLAVALPWRTVATGAAVLAGVMLVRAAAARIHAR